MNTSSARLASSRVTSCCSTVYHSLINSRVMPANGPNSVVARDDLVSKPDEDVCTGGGFGGAINPAARAKI